MQVKMAGDVFITTENGTESMLVDGEMKTGTVVHNCPIVAFMFTKDLNPEIMWAFMDGFEQKNYDDIIYHLNSVTQISDNKFTILTISQCEVYV